MFDLQPHMMCLTADPLVISLLVFFNAGIAVAYFAIPLAMLRYVRIRPPILLNLFVVFIVGCGVTHLLQVLTMYIGGINYWFDVLACGITLVASCCTALLLMIKGPTILQAYSRSGER